MTRYDLRILQPQGTGRSQRLLPAFFNDAGRGLACSGLEKLTQQAFLVLLTAKGSKRFAPDAGTNFVADGLRGAWRTTADVARSFVAAVLDVKRQLRSAAPTDAPDDERIDAMTLEGVAVAGDHVSLSIKITALSGAATVFTAPVRLVPQA